jgi:hypothetical protein
MDLLIQKAFHIHLVATKNRFDDLVSRFRHFKVAHFLRLGGHSDTGNFKSGEGGEVPNVSWMLFR